MPHTIALVYPNKESSSETFIKAHKECLPFEVIPMYGGYLPRYYGADIPLYDPSPGWQRYLGMKRKTHADAIKSFLSKSKSAAVLCEYGPTAAEMFPICRSLGIPMIAHFHGFDIYVNSIREAYIGKYRSIFQSDTAIVAVSSDMRNELIKAGAREEAVTVIPCGVDTDVFTPASNRDPQAILCAGRFVNKKAQHLVLLAFSRVAKDFPKAMLHFAGDGGLGSSGELYHACLQLAKALKLESQVQFHGAVTHDKMKSLMSSCSIFIQHSVRPPSGDSEGTPVTLLEASASEMGIVATRHGGIKDVVIENETGILTNENDLDATSDALRSLLNDRAFCVRLGKNARIRMKQNFDMKIAIRKLTEVIQSKIS